MKRIHICKASDVPPNGMKSYDTAIGVKVLIANTGDAYYGYQGVCPHQDVCLDEGFFDGTTLTIPGTPGPRRKSSRIPRRSAPSEPLPGARARARSSTAVASNPHLLGAAVRVSDSDFNGTVVISFL